MEDRMAIRPAAFKMGPSCHAAVSLSSYLLRRPAALYERPKDRIAPSMFLWRGSSKPAPPACFPPVLPEAECHAHESL